MSFHTTYAGDALVAVQPTSPPRWWKREPRPTEQRRLEVQGTKNSLSLQAGRRREDRQN